MIEVKVALNLSEELFNVYVYDNNKLIHKALAFPLDLEIPINENIANTGFNPPDDYQLWYSHDKQVYQESLS